MKKNGYVKSGSEVKKLFEDLDKRQDLVQMFKDSLLDKDSVCCFCWAQHATQCVLFLVSAACNSFGDIQKTS